MMCHRAHQPAARGLPVVLRRTRPPGSRSTLLGSPSLWPLVLLLLLTTFAGCGPPANTHELGVSAMHRGRIDEALIWLERTVLYDPGNSEARRDFGTALFLNGNAPAAVRELEQAQDLGLQDGTTTFYLGLAYEGVGRKYDAVDAYARYVQIGEFDELRGPLLVRLRMLTREIIADEVRLAMSTDGAAGVAPDPGMVAVLPFRTLLDDEELIALRSGLAALVAADLDRVEALQVVDRLKVASIRQSVDLEHGTMIDSLGAARTGRLLGAGRLVTASLTGGAGGTLGVEGAVADVASGAITWTDRVDEQVERFYEAQKRLVYSILQAMGIDPGADTRLAIDSSVPTQSLLALLAYGRGLEFEDRGLRGAARAAFLEAMNYDPGFGQVRSSLERLGLDDQIDRNDVLTPDDLAARDIDIRSHRNRAAGAGAAPSAGQETTEETAPAETTAQASTGEAGGSTPLEDFGSALDDLFGAAAGTAESRLDRTSEASQLGQTPQGGNDTREPLGEGAGAGSGFGTSTIDLQIPLPE